ncbi:MAG: hypothetical protein IT564_11415 [Rhodospirillales bacterium]|nr:hypothetical protein [Rhodospirillales bacterium]
MSTYATSRAEELDFLKPLLQSYIDLARAMHEPGIAQITIPTCHLGDLINIIQIKDEFLAEASLEIERVKAECDETIYRMFDVADDPVDALSPDDDIPHDDNDDLEY